MNNIILKFSISTYPMVHIEKKNQTTVKVNNQISGFDILLVGLLFF